MDNCYIGENIKEKDIVINKLIHNHPCKNIYCICVTSCSNNLLDIIKSREIVKDIYSNKRYKVIGIAQGKKEAFELTRKIIESVYKKYKDPTKIKEFFKLE